MRNSFGGAGRKLEHRTLGSGALGAALVCLSLGACALGPTGSGDDVGGAASELLTFSAREALPRAAWLAAEPGCEGRLDTTEPLELAFAEGEPELRVVLLRGLALCVDSASAVTEELAAHTLTVDGISEHLDSARRPDRYGALSYRTAPAAGDPSPQPSAPPQSSTASESVEARPNGGDPSPQPSDRTGTVAGDPSPQPSHPLHEALEY